MKKYASIYEIICCVVFFGFLCEEACPRCYLFDYFKVLVPSSYEEKILFWKDRLVMPLDMAMKMLNKSS
jgi:hypothetical protein